MELKGASFVQKTFLGTGLARCNTDYQARAGRGDNTAPGVFLCGFCCKTMNASKPFGCSLGSLRVLLGPNWILGLFRRLCFTSAPSYTRDSHQVPEATENLQGFLYEEESVFSLG